VKHATSITNQTFPGRHGQKLTAVVGVPMRTSARRKKDIADRDAVRLRRNHVAPHLTREVLTALV
jgi:hypothetical protein